MQEFGVEITTAELVTLERGLRSLGTDAARSAAGKAHLNAPDLSFEEREAVLTALHTLSADPPAEEWGAGLTRLLAKLEDEQSGATPTPPPRKSAARSKS